MKRSAFDERRDVRVADQYLQDNLPCRFCGTLTDRETLCNLGARCHSCYESYCAQTVPGWLSKRLPLSNEDRKDLAGRIRSGMARLIGHGKGARDWALKLQEREQAGERLLPFQAQAWRYALGVEKQTEEVDA